MRGGGDFNRKQYLRGNNFVLVVFTFTKNQPVDNFDQATCNFPRPGVFFLQKTVQRYFCAV